MELPDNLGTLFATLSPRAFQTGALAPLLLDFLALVARSEPQLGALGPGLVSALRSAMSDTVPLASADQIRAILTYVPRGILFPLPAAVEHRQVLRALATAPTTILPVRAVWSDDHVPQLQLSESDLKLLLEALEPHVGGDLADQAAPAALALLMRGSHDISRLARDPDFASYKCFERGMCAVALSHLCRFKSWLRDPRLGCSSAPLRRRTGCCRWRPRPCGILTL